MSARPEHGDPRQQARSWRSTPACSAAMSRPTRRRTTSTTAASAMPLAARQTAAAPHAQARGPRRAVRPGRRRRPRAAAGAAADRAGEAPGSPARISGATSPVVHVIRRPSGRGAVRRCSARSPRRHRPQGEDGCLDEGAGQQQSGHDRPRRAGSARHQREQAPDGLGQPGRRTRSRTVDIGQPPGRRADDVRTARCAVAHSTPRARRRRVVSRLPSRWATCRVAAAARYWCVVEQPARAGVDRVLGDVLRADRQAVAELDDALGHHGLVGALRDDQHGHPGVHGLVDAVHPPMGDEQRRARENVQLRHGPSDDHVGGQRGQRGGVRLPGGDDNGAAQRGERDGQCRSSCGSALNTVPSETYRTGSASSVDGERRVGRPGADAGADEPVGLRRTGPRRGWNSREV